MNAYKVKVQREDESARMRRVQEYAHAEAEKHAQEYARRKMEEYTRRFDALMLLTLHTEFGFGKERLLRFYKAMDDEYLRLTSMFNPDDKADNLHYWTWEKRLKEYTGIDLDELYAEYEREGNK